MARCWVPVKLSLIWQLNGKLDYNTCLSDLDSACNFSPYIRTGFKKRTFWTLNLSRNSCQEYSSVMYLYYSSRINSIISDLVFCGTKFIVEWRIQKILLMTAYNWTLCRHHFNFSSFDKTIFPSGFCYLSASIDYHSQCIQFDWESYAQEPWSRDKSVIHASR